MAGPPPPIDEAPKTTQKTTKPGKRTPAHGRGKLNTGGTPGNKGGSGRPSTAIKAIWAGQIDRESVHQANQVILDDPNHPAHTALWSKVAIMAYGIPGRQDDADPEGAIPHVHMDL